MDKIDYEVIEHDGGWAYKVQGVISETFPDHKAAHRAAEAAAQRQSVPGTSEPIEFQDEKGAWHTETASGSDRPETDVVDEDFAKG